jgi:hypothetical protein
MRCDCEVAGFLTCLKKGDILDFYVLYSTLLLLPPLRSTVSEDAGIELRTVATLAWQSDAGLDLIDYLITLYGTAQDMIKTPCQYVPTSELLYLPKVRHIKITKTVSVEGQSLTFPDPDPALFVSDLQLANKNNFFS